VAASLLARRVKPIALLALLTASLVPHAPMDSIYSMVLASSLAQQTFTVPVDLVTLASIASLSTLVTSRVVTHAMKPLFALFAVKVYTSLMVRALLNAHLGTFHLDKVPTIDTARKRAFPRRTTATPALVTLAFSVEMPNTLLKVFV